MSQLVASVARLTADSLALLHCGRRPPPHPRNPRPAGGENGEKIVLTVLCHVVEQLLHIASSCFILFPTFGCSALSCPAVFDSEGFQSPIKSEQSRIRKLHWIQKLRIQKLDVGVRNWTLDSETTGVKSTATSIHYILNGAGRSLMWSWTSCMNEIRLNCPATEGATATQGTIHREETVISS